MNATAFQRAIERTMRAKTTSEIDEAATPLADYRDGLENGTEEIGAIATDKTLLGLARVYCKLIGDRRSGLYTDHDNAALCDVTHILATLLRGLTAAAKACAQRFCADASKLRALQSATMHTLVRDEHFFHCDACMLSANLLLVLDRQCNSRLEESAALYFASQVEGLLIKSGNYNLQNHIMWLLIALSESYPKCKAVMERLEGEHAQLEPEVLSSPSPEVDRRPSPRKLLNAYNKKHESTTSVLTVMPLAVTAFGKEVRVHEHSWVDFNLRSEDLTWEIFHGQRQDVIFDRDLSAVYIASDDGHAKVDMRLVKGTQQERYWMHLYLTDDAVPPGERDSRLSFCFDTDQILQIARKVFPTLEKLETLETKPTLPPILQPYLNSGSPPSAALVTPAARKSSTTSVSVPAGQHQPGAAASSKQAGRPHDARPPDEQHAAAARASGSKAAERRARARRARRASASRPDRAPRAPARSHSSRRSRRTI